MYTGLRGDLIPTDKSINYNAAWATGWWCLGPFGSLFPECTPPTPQQVAADDSFYGATLSAASQAVATAATQEIVANDPSLRPVSGYNWWVIGGLVFGAAMLLKKV